MYTDAKLETIKEGKVTATKMADIMLSNIIHVSQERKDNNLSMAGMICKLNSSHYTRKKEGKEKRGGGISRDFILHNKTNINTHRITIQIILLKDSKRFYILYRKA